MSDDKNSEYSESEDDALKQDGGSGVQRKASAFSTYYDEQYLASVHERVLEEKNQRESLALPHHVAKISSAELEEEENKELFDTIGERVCPWERFRLVPASIEERPQLLSRAVSKETVSFKLNDTPVSAGSPRQRLQTANGGVKTIDSDAEDNLSTASSRTVPDLEQNLSRIPSDASIYPVKRESTNLIVRSENKENVERSPATNTDFAKSDPNKSITVNPKNLLEGDYQLKPLNILEQYPQIGYFGETSLENLSKNTNSRFLAILLLVREQLSQYQEMPEHGGLPRNAMLDFPTLVMILWTVSSNTLLNVKILLCHMDSLLESSDLIFIYGLNSVDVIMNCEFSPACRILLTLKLFTELIVLGVLFFIQIMLLFPNITISYVTILTALKLIEFLRK